MFTDKFGNKYEPQVMTPREQFHVGRRLTPLLSTSGDAILALLDDEADKGEVMAKLARTIGPLTDVLATLPDELVDFVLDACLVHVNRMSVGQDSWHPIYVRGKPAVRMYQDIDGMLEMRLVSEVLKLNLVGFFAQLSGVSASPLSAPTAA